MEVCLGGGTPKSQYQNTNAVYDTILLPKTVKPITSKPVFRIKFDQNRHIERYKVRIVAQGFCSSCKLRVNLNYSSPRSKI
ncbi:hypothetical protein SERLA73DRAFT_44312 [Serpula lacrymans var. lacrymans S7.3]|uniref:Uncharacterized protein n=1 Tax=Serpula lacrymans var. lacrymans (strain S7.3) TaxID=936435 RepID=F8PHZ1_SERL3|nr:hypothetical protein SERLA73DRAFT_44312 [Serpula lacrymans var. lacrymans S7.3]